MSDILCVGMGIFDLIAGILIMFSFDFSGFSIVFSLIMIVKGAMSFI